MIAAAISSPAKNVGGSRCSLSLSSSVMGYPQNRINATRMKPLAPISRIVATDPASKKHS